MKIAMISFLGLFLFFVTGRPQAQEWDYKVDFTKCVQATDAGRQSNGQRALTFYNGCGQLLYINVCVLTSDGYKLYTSGSGLKGNSSMTIYTFPYTDPRAVAWTADGAQPIIPGYCGKSDGKASKLELYTPVETFVAHL
jgi:hypothetical protein